MKHSYNLMALPALILLLSMCTTPPTGPLATQIADSNTQLAASAMAFSTEARTLTPVVPAQPTASPTSSIVEVTRGAPTTPIPHIIEVNTTEVEWLAALCWVETKGMGDKRATTCASVIDTVMERIRRNKMTGGDIFSTITYGCNEDTIECQFPAYAVRGCQGIIPQACPFYDTEGMIYYQGVVLEYLTGDITPECPNRLYYGSREADMRDCIIESDGQRIGFFNE